MNKKALLITLILLLVVLGVAAVLYPKLSAGMQINQLATTATQPEEETIPTTEATQPTTEEPTEPPVTTTATEPPETTEPTEPEPVKAPNFTGVDWDGNEVQFSDYVGKPIVLNFWTYWCDYCLLEMPEFNAIYEELGGEVTFLMVHADTDTESGKQIIDEAGYTFPVIFDEERIAKMTYGVNSYPITFFIDAQGNLKAYYSGMMGEDILRQGIDLIYTAE